MEEDWLGLLEIRILKGINLAKRDFFRRSSDPYVLVKMGQQRVKTRVVKQNVNPQWNEKLTVPIVDQNLPITISVYDRDTLSFDDKMGDAALDIRPFLEATKMHLESLSSNSIIMRVQPNKQNCLAKESHIIWINGDIVQNMLLRLQNVEQGEVELQLKWIDIIR